MIARTISSYLVGAFAVALCTATANVGGAAPPKKLSITLPAFSNIHSDFKIGPDGSWVVYRADQDQDEVYELYCVALTGGAPVKLSSPLSNAGDVSSWQLDAAGDRAIYWANPQGNNLYEVFSASIVGGGSVTLNRPLVDKGSTDGTVSSERVVYIASERTNAFFEPYFDLFSVPAAGGTVEQLSGSLVNGGDVQTVYARQNSDRVIYLADQDTNDVVELYGVSVLGGLPTKLNGPMVTNGDVSSDGFQLSPSGNRVIYAADQQQDSRVEVFSVPTLGGEAVRLNGVLANGGNVTASSLQFSPDSARVLYHADQNVDETFEVFSVAATGGTPVRLNGPLVANGDVRAAGLQFSPLSNRVLYTADQNEDEVYELFSVPGSGGTAVRLNGALVEGGDVLDDATFSPDGGRVLYRADELANDVVELFSVPSTGGVSVRLNEEMVANGNVTGASFSPDGSRVAYLADQDQDEMFELFIVPSSGGVSQKISGALTAGGNVTDWLFTPDGKKIVYRADQDVDEKFELFAVDLALSVDIELPGDFNGSGIVDAADYTVWRNGLATNAYSPEQYGIWKANFGRRNTDGAGAALGEPLAIPEPATFALILTALAWSSRVGRRSAEER